MLAAALSWTALRPVRPDEAIATLDSTTRDGKEQGLNEERRQGLVLKSSSSPDARLATVWKGLVTGAGSLPTGAGSSGAAG